jgi:cell division protein FtsN
VLQIGAFDNEPAANGAWTRFRTRYDSAGTLFPDIQKVDLGAKGIWYRLRAGPFADRTAAVAACTKLKAAGATCFVTAP